MSSINMNNESLKMILHFLNEKKWVNFLKLSAEHVNDNKKIYVSDKVFKRLNDDLINIFVWNFKFDRHKLFKARIKFLRVVHEISFKSAQLSRDLDFFINHDFLNIYLKCSRNNWFDVISINRILASRKSFIFQQF